MARAVALWRKRYPDGSSKATPDFRADVRQCLAYPFPPLDDGATVPLLAYSVVRHESACNTVGPSRAYSADAPDPPTDFGPAQITLSTWLACQALAARTAKFIAKRSDAATSRFFVSILSKEHADLGDHRTAIRAACAVLLTKLMTKGATTGTQLLRDYGGHKWATR